MLRQADAYAGPGIEGEKYVQLARREVVPPQRFLRLPNIVDEAAFLRRDDTIDAGRRWLSERGLDVNRPTVVWPARLRGAKGILPFLDRWAEVRPPGWQVLLLGQGELRAEVLASIERLRLGESVRLFDYIDHRQMPAIYAVSTLFLLPSLHDPNPLSVVEAMHSGLPLLISSRLGNYPEALAPGENGWGFDPDKPADVADAIRSATSSSEGRRREMGVASARIAARYWSSREATQRFVSGLLDLVASGPEGRGRGTVVSSNRNVE